ncbi:hypothetical protein BUE80_DR003590 [Diplocarpon rosae]|nr:hypothetical protein BUE80_DR003590 [Diplocarpon rosae]
MPNTPYIISLAVATYVGHSNLTYCSDPTSGTFICPADKPNGAFCAGDSLSTNIIIRCKDGVGQPGNCNDNLAGYFPYGVRSAPCWQSSATSGVAACSKNCVVQGGSGTYNGTLTLPNCTPIPQPSSTASTANLTYVQPSHTPMPNTTQSYSNSDASGSTSPVITSAQVNSGPYNGTTITSTVTTTCVTDGSTTTSTSTFTTTYSPDITLPSISTVITTVMPSGAVGAGSTVPSGGSDEHSSNGTITPSDSHTSATATPVGPTTAPPASFGPELSNGAMANSAAAGVCLVALASFVAYFL